MSEQPLAVEVPRNRADRRRLKFRPKSVAHTLRQQQPKRTPLDKNRIA